MMITEKRIQIFHQSDCVNAISNIRRQWQDAAPCQSLVDVDASVGLLLLDVVTVLGFNQTEKIEALGNDLFEDLSDLLTPTEIDYHR
jgi:hypothetical protein